MSASPSDGDVFDALADPTRRALLREVVLRAPVTATELAADLPISRQAVAKHLHLLDSVGLVSRTRVGRETRFDAHLDRLDEAAQWIDDTNEAWRGRLQRLARLDQKQTG